MGRGEMTLMSVMERQSIFVELTDTIYVVKAKWNSEIRPTKIHFLGSTLEDAHTLAECGIELSDTLMVSVSPFSS